MASSSLAGHVLLPGAAKQPLCVLSTQPEPKSAAWPAHIPFPMGSPTLDSF